MNQLMPDVAGSYLRAFSAKPQRNALAQMATPPAGESPQYQAQAMAGGPTNLAAGILETAQSLGMDPVDLATIISYETAGTFDPTKAGPTTQWGQHRGLIQFGEPQAQEYGVNWDDPVGSQLGAEGAVARYFKKNGWRPGMGLLDAYSIVNAGGPGRYNRSDANNGGAPGTVADKVRDQMGGHRKKAEALLAGITDRRQPNQPSQYASLEQTERREPWRMPEGGDITRFYSLLGL